MTDVECKKVMDAVVDAFYARHPEVMDAVISDALFHGRGTMPVETEALIHIAFGADLLDIPAK